MATFWTSLRLKRTQSNYFKHTGWWETAIRNLFVEIMTKECLVVLNNEVVTVVRFDDKDVQFPSIRKNTRTVFVNYEDGKYSIVDGCNAAKKTSKTKERTKFKKTTVKQEDTTLLENDNEHGA